MIVTEKTFFEVVSKLASEAVLFVDTETTGLRIWLEDKVFSIIISGWQGSAFYFNFNPLEKTHLLGPDHVKILQDLFGFSEKTYVFHNAKFDMAGLLKMGIPVKGTVYDTEVNARIIYNEHLSYSLDNCLKRIGLAKSDAVEDYIEKHKLWEWETQPGKKKKEKRKFFHKVPIDIIVPYACSDVTGMRALYKDQQQTLTPEHVSHKISGIESKFTKTLFDLESAGVAINKDYCQKAFDHEMGNYRAVARSLSEKVGENFIDSRTFLPKLFKGYETHFSKTDAGNLSFDDEALDSIPAPTVQELRKYREHYKKAHTYYQNFMFLSGKSNVIHCNFKQSKARTARLSCSDPNLQNVPKRESKDSVFTIRKSFIPRPGFFFVEIDYKAMEFRMLLDYAGELELIAQIKNGLDVHSATAELIQSSRDAAKTLNFALIYGMGNAKLAAALGLTLEEAKKFKKRYFRALPYVQLLIEKIMHAAEVRGSIRNWAGRVYQFPDKTFSYKAPNTLIQGGSSDVVRVAMNNISDFLQGKNSRMLLQVHDSILFEIHESEAHIVEELKNIMEKAYPYKHLPLECDVKYGKTSWGELVDWGEFGKEARDGIQGEAS